jgi:ParB-like chromosome segregation protein Spo0J
MNKQSQIAIRQHIALRAPDALKPAERNARTHSRKQLREIAGSIQRFGFTNPVLVDEDDRILAGHGRVAAARELGMAAIPVLCIGSLSPSERRAYVLADNKLALNAGWDQDLLALELQELIDMDFEVELTGFSLAEIDLTLDAAREASPNGHNDTADIIPAIGEQPVCRSGELWELERHRLLCGVDL